MATLWPYIPSRVGETLRFSTDVRMARSGEFRDSLHDATQILGYEYTLVSANPVLLEQRFRTNPAGEWLVPIWHDMTITEGLGYGDTYIMVDEGDYRASGKAFVYQDDSNYEIVDIDTYGSGQINLVGFLSQDYDEGTLVAPVLTAIAPNGLTRSTRINVTDYSVTFYVTEPKNLSAANLATYEGYDIANMTPAVLSSLDGSLKQKLDFIENGFGSMALVTQETYTRWRGSLSYVDYTNATRWATREFLHRCRGKDRPFWLPTFSKDLRLANPSGAFATSLQIVANRVYNSSDLVGRYIYFEDITGSPVGIREIDAVSGTSPITIQLSSGFAFSTAVEDTVEFVHLVRFDSDQFEIEHRRIEGGWLSTVSSPVVEVKG